MSNSLAVIYGAPSWYQAVLCFDDVGEQILVSVLMELIS